MQKHRGFTLVELLIVMTLISILASLAYPSFQETIRLNRIQAQTSQLLSALMLARSEGVKSNLPTVMCKSSNGSSCSTSSTEGWEMGWIVFTDNDGDATLDSGEPIIKVQDSTTISDDISIDPGTIGDLISFRPDGTAIGLGAASAAQSFTISSNGQTHNSRQIQIDPTGRPRVVVN